MFKFLKILIFYWKELLNQSQIKQTNKKKGFLRMLLGTLGASLRRNILSGKGFVRAGFGSKEGKGILRAGYGNKTKN